MPKEIAAIVEVCPREIDKRRELEESGFRLDVESPIDEVYILIVVELVRLGRLEGKKSAAVRGHILTLMDLFRRGSTLLLDHPQLTRPECGL
ncbi:MAG: hypothetical protein WCB12_14110 [Bryobacteraceae bacterium]